MGERRGRRAVVGDPSKAWQNGGGSEAAQAEATELAEVAEAKE